MNCFVFHVVIRVNKAQESSTKTKFVYMFSVQGVRLTLPPQTVFTDFIYILFLLFWTCQC